VLFTGIHHTEKINRGPQDPPDSFQPFTVLGHHDHQDSIRAQGASEAEMGDGTIMVVPVRFRTEIAIGPSLDTPHWMQKQSR
jgi:hypothetical protein